ncbi:MAG: hypothetical protein KJZ65_02360 [Phycisphaerales bacterium]|nr:hypothetical protein [Phycisphaerales bacterium]
MNTTSPADRAGWSRGPIRCEEIAAVLADDGYHVSAVADNLLRVVEPESGVVVLAALEGSVLFFTISCLSVPPHQLTGDLLGRMITSGNGISTSSFRLVERSDGTVAVTLNNFCKLQDMGPEDRDDLLSCIEFLLVDVLFARALIERTIP